MFAAASWVVSSRLEEALMGDQETECMLRLVLPSSTVLPVLARLNRHMAVNAAQLPQLCSGVKTVVSTDHHCNGG